MVNALVSTLKLPRAATGGKGVVQTAHNRLSTSRPVKPAELPAELSGIWDTIVDALDEAGLVAAVDGPTLELALRHYLVAIMASDDLLASSSTTRDDKNGREMKNPASQVFRDHSTAYLEFAKQLGLSFVSRSRVTMSKGDPDDGNPFSVAVNG